MFFVKELFWMIVGLGMAIPATALIFNNLLLARFNPGYQLDIMKTLYVYFVALVGWAIVIALWVG